MSRLTCKCGKNLSNSNNPEIVFRVFTDDEWNSLIDRTEQGEKPLDFRGYSVFYWKCTNCKRLHFFKNNLDNRFAVYKLEEKDG